jgi:hypothetical protein
VGECAAERVPGHDDRLEPSQVLPRQPARQALDEAGHAAAGRVVRGRHFGCCPSFRLMPGNGPLDGAGETAQRRCAVQLCHRDGRAELLAQGRDQLYRGQRVAARLKEILLKVPRNLAECDRPGSPGGIDDGISH